MCVPYSLLGHLFLEREEEVGKPLKGGGLGADPVEIDLLESDLGVLVNQLVVDRLQDGGKWSHSNPGTHQDSDITVKYILTTRRERERERVRERSGKRRWEMVTGEREW